MPGTLLAIHLSLSDSDGTIFAGRLTGLPFGPSSPGGPLAPAGPAAPGGPASPFSPLSPLGPYGSERVMRGAFMTAVYY